MITLAHLSDIHLAPLPPVRWPDLVNKRITGFINWKLHRKASLNGDGTTLLVRHLRARQPDHIAVTGDLTNLALDAEINTAFNWLQTVGTPETVSVIPGNHDAYIPGALDRAIERWGDYMRGETLEAGKQFPYIRRIGKVAIIACSSAVPTLPWMAFGRIGDHQSARLGRYLRELGDAGYFRVVLIHHPPNPEARDVVRGLWNGSEFRKVIKACGAEIVLHGHTHRSTIHQIEGPTAQIPVIGVAAAGAAPNGPDKEDPARYNLFRISEDGGKWDCVMREYGFQRRGTDIVMRMQLSIY